MRLLIACLASACLAVSACSEAPDDAGSRELASSPDGLCVEHGVLEAVCTQCNPKLASIFQGKGDWCQEHGFPESFCPRCHPERGGRPAMDVASEEAPLDGTKILLGTPEAVRAAGIEVAAASEPRASELALSATIAYDPLRQHSVIAGASGVVQELWIDVGVRVSEGAPLVRIESAEIGALQSHLRAASSRVEVAKAAQVRTEALLAKGMAADKDLLAARLELDTAQADLDAVTAALGMIQIEAGTESRYVLLAPADGTVVSVTAAAGRRVGAEQVLCEIVDTSVMLAEIDVPELELARVAAGLEVTLTVDALPGREFSGKLDSIASDIDRRTRTARARVKLDNPDGALRANMFARARISLARSAARALIPEEALQRAEDAELVFVQLAPDRYEARLVKAGAHRGDEIEILEGLEPGTLVATRGSFLLKTEVLKGSIGAGCCEVE